MTNKQINNEDNKIFPLGYLLSIKGFILSTFAVVYIALFTHAFLKAIFNSGLNEWVVTDWLTNYSSGFVRRGLPGSILLLMTEYLNFNPYISLTIFVSLLYLLVSIFYIYKFFKLQHFMNSTTLIVLLFLPSLLLFPLNDLGRKEMLFIIPLIMNLSFLCRELNKLKSDELIEPSSRNNKNLDSSIKRYRKNILIWFNLLAVPIALSHESIILLSLPINLVITVNFISLKTSRKRILLDSFIIYIPTAVSALAGFIWKGDASVALSICESWQNLGILDCSNGPPAALKGIGWSLKQGLLLSWGVIKADGGLIFLQWLIIIALNLIFLISSSSKLVSNLLENFNSDWDDKVNFRNSRKIYSSFSFKYAAIPIICSIPIYILGYDWGRWFFVAAISYSFCSLSPSLIYLEIANHNQSKRFNLLNRVFHRLYLIYSKFLANLLFLLEKYSSAYKICLIYVLLFVTLPVCCLEIQVFYTGLVNRLVSAFSAGLALIFN